MNKKFASICIVTIILINLLIVSAFAGATPLVSIESTTGNVGTTVEIPVVLSDNSGFSSLGIEIGYDKAALTLTNVTQGTGIGANFTNAPTLTTNPYNMSWDSASNTEFNGMLAILTFKVLKTGTYPITVDYYKGRNGTYTDGKNVNYDENFNSLNLSYVNGSVTARKTSSSGGMIVSGISFSIQLSGDTTIGKVYAALYSSEGKLKVLKQYPASEIVNVSFAPGETGAYVKMMWWNENLQPMCGAQTIPL